MKIQRPNFEVLDCLRGIAALYVVINHSRGNLLIGGSELAAVTPVSEWSIFTKIYYSLLQFTALGTEFVIVFFVLSGFSIAFSLSSKQNIFTFYYKRLLRLYPPYLLGLLLAGGAFALFHSVLPSFTAELSSVFDSFHKIVLNLLYIHDGAYIPQYWSLVHEVLFYAIAPFVILRRRWFYVATSVLYVIGLWVSWNAVAGETIITRFLFDYSLYFAVGIFVFHNYETIAKRITVNKLWTFIISAIFITAMVGVKFLADSGNKITFLMSALLSIFWIVNFQKNNISSKLLLFLGTMSYTLYVTHFISLKLFQFILIQLDWAPENAKITNPIVWMLGVVFAVGLSYVFYLIAEKPSKDLLVNIRRRIKAKSQSINA